MKDKNLPITGQLFSEQELVGAFIFKNIKKTKRSKDN